MLACCHKSWLNWPLSYCLIWPRNSIRMVIFTIVLWLDILCTCGFTWAITISYGLTGFLSLPLRSPFPTASMLIRQRRGSERLILTKDGFILLGSSMMLANWWHSMESLSGQWWATHFLSDVPSQTSVSSLNFSRITQTPPIQCTGKVKKNKIILNLSPKCFTGLLLFFTY